MVDPDAATGCRAALWRGLRAVHLSGHLVGALAWILLFPGGFPIEHARFWVNRALPVVVVGATGVALVCLWRRRDVGADRVALALVGFWVGVAGSWLWTFPTSRLRAAALLCVLVGPQVALAGAAILRSRVLSRGHACASLLGVVLGAGVPATQFAPPAATRPSSDPMPQVPPRAIAAPPARSIVLTPHVEVLSDRGVVRATGAVAVEVAPLLTFGSRSLDRGWTLLARARDRAGPPRRLTATLQSAETVTALYEQDGPQRLDVTRGTGLHSATLVAWSGLPEPVYSHLNTWCRIDVRGPAEPVLVFSPCRDTPVPVRGARDVLGRPVARFAYVDAEAQFHVVEAGFGEKGPFRTLASGRLGDQPLEITFCDGPRRVARIVLHDWSRQVDPTTLSPTAGWGVPVNAIEFFAGRTDSVSMYVTLAGTSVGRGWDSVGHRAGTYRNRMEIEVEPE